MIFCISGTSLVKTIVQWVLYCWVVFSNLVLRFQSSWEYEFESHSSVRIAYRQLRNKIIGEYIRNLHEGSLKKDILEWWRYSWTFSCEKMSGTCDELSTLKHPKRGSPSQRPRYFTFKHFVFILLYESTLQIPSIRPSTSTSATFEFCSFLLVILPVDPEPFHALVQKEAANYGKARQKLWFLDFAWNKTVVSMLYAALRPR